MVRYRRNFVAGGTYFFTATLVDRTSSALIDHVNALRAAIRVTRRAHPFMIDAVVVLPDHLHIVLTLPADDADFPNRWRLIKRRFTTGVLKTGALCRAPPEWRARALAASILGAHHPRRQGLRATRRLHPLQSRQARACGESAGLAALVISSLCAARVVARRLGRRCLAKSGKLRRADRLAPDFAFAQSGLHADAACARPPSSSSASRPART